MDDKEQAAIDALRSAGLEAEARAIEELRLSHKNTLNAFVDGHYASKAEGIKEGLRRAAEIAGEQPAKIVYVSAINVDAAFSLGCAACKDAILKEIGE